MTRRTILATAAAALTGSTASLFAEAAPTTAAAVKIPLSSVDLPTVNMSDLHKVPYGVYWLSGDNVLYTKTKLVNEVLFTPTGKYLLMVIPNALGDRTDGKSGKSCIVKAELASEHGHKTWREIWNIYIGQPVTDEFAI